MSTVIKPKRSFTSAAVPSVSDLEIGELAMNVADGKFYTKSNSSTIKEVGGASAVNIQSVLQAGAVATTDLTMNNANIIFEGASWTGFIYISYLFFIALRIKAKFIYHAHNVDFFFRKKNIFISSLSFYFEKKILQNFYISTSVSKADFTTFKSLFKIKTKILPNGIEVKKKKLKKR